MVLFIRFIIIYIIKVIIANFIHLKKKNLNIVNFLSFDCKIQIPLIQGVFYTINPICSVLSKSYTTSITVNPICKFYYNAFKIISLLPFLKIYICVCVKQLILYVSFTGQVNKAILIQANLLLQGPTSTKQCPHFTLQFPLDTICSKR